MVDKEEEPTWGKCGEAQFDFRTDSHTTPTVEMLQALSQATMNDDVFREDNPTKQFEADMAAMAGHEDGCIAVSGTMANQIAMLVLFQQPPYSLLTDSRAHIVHFEGGGTSFLTGASVQVVKPSNNRYLTLKDIQSKAILSDDIQKAPTKVISLECTAHGAITPVSEFRRIAEWARRRDIRLHLDGARLFEAVAANAGSLRDYCSLFDTVYLDFAKNLGAPLGTMLLGSSALIRRARHVRKVLGGGVRMTGMISSVSRAAVEANFGWDGRGSKAHQLRLSHRWARMLGEAWQRYGGRLTRPVETNIVWLDIKRAGYNAATWERLGRKKGVKLDGPRVVVHHQNSDEALQRMLELFRECLSPSAAVSKGPATPAAQPML
ncbi:Alanine racemase TOXG [Exophiala dermatitidis]